MANHLGDEKLMMHVFQESLIGSPTSWYMSLDRAKAGSWNEMKAAFVNQYRHNIDYASDRTALQTLEKNREETFRAYAVRWRDLASQVQPPLTDKEFLQLFINTLKGPYYEKLVCCTSTNFPDLILLGDRIEEGIRSGKIYDSTAKIIKNVYSKKWEVQEASVGRQEKWAYPSEPSHVAQPNNQPLLSNQGRREFSPIPLSYNALYDQLRAGGRITTIPTKPYTTNFPAWYNANKTCKYHSDVPGHDIENCVRLKYKIQEMIDGGKISFKSKMSDVNANPLPNHGRHRVNVVSTNENERLNMVSQIKMPMKRLFEILSSAKLVQPRKPKYGEYIISHIIGGAWQYHEGARDHTIQSCKEFQEVVLKLMDCHYIQLFKGKCSENVFTVGGSEKPFDIWYPSQVEPIDSNEEQFDVWIDANESAEVSFEVQYDFQDPIDHFIVDILSSAMNTKMIPRTYDEGIALQVNDVAGTSGMTRSGRCYRPRENEKISKEVVKENKEDRKAKNDDHKKVEDPLKIDIGSGSKANNVRFEPKETVINNEEAEEFFKLIKQSEYDVVHQLSHTPSRISIMKFLMDSEKHRNTLMEILSKAYVPPDITVNNLENIVNSIKTTRLLTFTDEDIPSEGRCHNKPLYISIECKGCTIARVLIDNGSSLNVMPKSTLECLPAEGSSMKPSDMVVKAFDGSCRSVIGEVELPVKIGPCTFNISFCVMDIPISYSCLLGRPWIHCAGAVSSTLHQQIKFAMDDQLIIVKAEDDILVTKPISTLYTKAVEEASKSTFRTFEVVNVSHVKTSPRVLASSLMVAKVLKREGFEPHKGLGKLNEGIREPIAIKGNTYKAGLGYLLTNQDKKRMAKEKREMRQAKSEKREPWVEEMKIPPLHKSFRYGGIVNMEKVEEDGIVVSFSDFSILTIGEDSETNGP